ncbi:MAG: hypothetical protein DMG21_08225 [Acidobacteria bacterium]|nr:MAG: hypothetical protein DMG21_08225 [Acidobacteriota bacterium]
MWGDKWPLASTIHKPRNADADIIKAGEPMESKAISIGLTPEQEKIVQDELSSGRFRTAEEVISEALDALQEKELGSAKWADDGAQREAVREMLAFVEHNYVRLEGLSVKELIHKGHRL